MKVQRKLFRKDMLRCALCDNPPCSSACGAIDCAGALRSIWFDNEDTAAQSLPEQSPCIGCSAPCEKACVFPGEVPIRSLMERLHAIRAEIQDSAPGDCDRLKTNLCGIPLDNPFLLSSSVVASSYDMCARAFEMGWAGAAFKTVSMLDIHEASPRFSAVKDDIGSIYGFKNIEQLSDHSLIENAEIFRKLKQNYPNKFLLVSIMGRNEAEWTEISRVVTEAGADAIELNFSCPNMAEDGLGSDIGQIPELVERFTAAAKRGTHLPVLAKLTPNTGTMSEAALAAKRGGADGLAAINTIKCITGINPHTYVSAPAVHGYSAVGGYSGIAVKPIALRFIAELGSNPALHGMHISGMGGVETWRDALDFILLGVGSIQVTTAVMQYGYRIIDDLISGLNGYLAEKGVSHVDEMVGCGLSAIKDAELLERDTVIFPKFDRTKCIGCGRCFLSCRDGGHQAIHMNESHKPVLNGKQCVGCHLCALVCPVGAITSSGKRIHKV